jgi:hypothetical protein
MRQTITAPTRTKVKNKDKQTKKTNKNTKTTKKNKKEKQKKKKRRKKKTHIEAAQQHSSTAKFQAKGYK